MVAYTANLTEKDLLALIADHFGVESSAVTLKHNPGCKDQRDYLPPSVSVEVRLPAIPRPARVPGHWSGEFGG